MKHFKRNLPLVAKIDILQNLIICYTLLTPIPINAGLSLEEPMLDYINM